MDMTNEKALEVFTAEVVKAFAIRGVKPRKVESHFVMGNHAEVVLEIGDHMIWVRWSLDQIRASLLVTNDFAVEVQLRVLDGMIRSL